MLPGRVYQALLLLLFVSIAAWGLRMNTPRLLHDLTGTWEACSQEMTAPEGSPCTWHLVQIPAVMTAGPSAQWDHIVQFRVRFPTPASCAEHSCKLILGKQADAAVVTVNGVVLQHPPGWNAYILGERRRPLGVDLPPALLRSDGTSNQLLIKMRAYGTQYTGITSSPAGIMSYEEGTEYLHWCAFHAAFLPLAISLLTAIVISCVAFLPLGGVGLPHRRALYRYAAASALFMFSFTRLLQLALPAALIFPVHFVLRFFADYALLCLCQSALGKQTRLYKLTNALYKFGMCILIAGSVLGISAASNEAEGVAVAYIRDFLFFFYPTVSLCTLLLGFELSRQRRWSSAAIYLCLAAVGFHDWLLGYMYITGFFITKYAHFLATICCLLAIIRRAVLAQAHERAARKAETDLANLARQVDHDIRSPLAALDMATSQLEDSPDDVRAIVRMAVGRIRDIADSIRASHCPPSTHAPVHNHQPPPPLLLASLVEAAVAEKRMQFTRNLHLRFDLDLTSGSYNHFVQAAASPLKRVFSNLLNNAAEAMDGAGVVRVVVRGDQTRAYVSIIDKGPGMPPEALARLGEKGATFGKSGGTGLGIHHAIATIRRLQGDVRFVMPPDGGTQVTIDLPRAPAPNWFADKLVLRPEQQVLVLDNDCTIHAAWKQRLLPAGARLTHVSSQTELEHWLRDADMANATFLVDYELGGGHKNGLDVIQGLQLQRQSYLVTSHFETAEVLERCSANGVRMIPKSMINIVPIHHEGEAP